MIKIVTDSTSLITEAQAKQYGITVIPLNVLIGDEVYKDGVTINGQELVDYIENNPNKAFPTTSQPAIGDFIQTYEQLTADGSQVISIHMTEILSGTVNTAQQAARMIGDDKVTVINTHTTDQILGQEVLAAAQLAQAGASRDAICDRVNQIIDHSKLYIAVSTLKNLERGGRISRVTGMISKLFNLHVILHLTDTELGLKAKGRGNKTLKKWVREYVESIKGRPLKFVGLSYTGSEEFAEFVKEQVKAEFPDAEVKIMYTSAIVSIHAGINACGMEFIFD
ncbi:DegV family protein [Nicoliella spurrieriana]|uniref:DegV family protein n=1 Tax=Nicoliella spurrieriana TaxID=2925830 RepID=A0A976RQY6_9LACO|nr:DegV family protein [Nicoliella spurrieriana]UQS86270.1 DegV family protein [Nicoliella spurrieriana]